jgi:hypothetical protein
MSIENPQNLFETDSQKDPVVQEILGDLYKPEKILAQKVEQISDGKISVTFLFPPYERTIQPLEHVSMSQMHEAVLDGLYCTIGQAIKTRAIDTPIDFQMFQARRLDSIYFRENFSFRKMLKVNEPAELTFEVVHVEEKRLRKKFYSIVIRIDGFLRGEVECLLEKPE